MDGTVLSKSVEYVNNKPIDSDGNKLPYIDSRGELIIPADVRSDFRYWDKKSESYLMVDILRYVQTPEDKFYKHSNRSSDSYDCRHCPARIIVNKSETLCKCREGNKSGYFNPAENVCLAYARNYNKIVDNFHEADLSKEYEDAMKEYEAPDKIARFDKLMAEARSNMDDFSGCCKIYYAALNCEPYLPSNKKETLFKYKQWLDNKREEVKLGVSSVQEGNKAEIKRVIRRRKV